MIPGTEGKKRAPFSIFGSMAKRNEDEEKKSFERFLDQRRATRRSYLDVQHLLGPSKEEPQVKGSCKLARYPFFPVENFLLKQEKMTAKNIEHLIS